MKERTDVHKDRLGLNLLDLVVRINVDVIFERYGQGESALVLVFGIGGSGWASFRVVEACHGDLEVIDDRRKTLLRHL
jgi:hypothetical protein